MNFEEIHNRVMDTPPKEMSIPNKSKLLLLTMISYVDRHKNVPADRKMLSNLTGIPQETIRMHITKYIKLGYLEKQKVKNEISNKQATIYHFNFNLLMEVTRSEEGVHS